MFPFPNTPVYDDYQLPSSLLARRKCSIPDGVFPDSSLSMCPNTNGAINAPFTLFPVEDDVDHDVSDGSLQISPFVALATSPSTISNQGNITCDGKYRTQLEDYVVKPWEFYLLLYYFVCLE